MKYRAKLFSTRDIYNLPATDATFVQAMKANLAFHQRHCPEYAALLEQFGYDAASINSVDDLHKIPPLPTSYLKNHTLLSKPYERLVLKTTSSGTGGKKTLSGFDASSGLCGISMLLRVFHHHNLLSARRTNYIILGYQPDKSNQSAMAKALVGVTMLAPRHQIAYALTVDGDGYTVNAAGLLDAIQRFSQQNRPVRIVGFPAYLKLFLDELIARDMQLALHEDSKILVGGGWKAMLAEQLSKEELFQMANRTLGISRQNFKDHFSTAEHPIDYVSCQNNHFHVPAYSRVIIRDVRTLAPVPIGTPGVLNLMTPLLSSAPFGSILTDDIAVMKRGEECGCGICSPYFELLGRVGLASVKTCAQTASEFLANV